MNFEAYMKCLDVLRVSNMLDEQTAKELYSITFKKQRENGMARQGRQPKYDEKTTATWDWTNPDIQISREQKVSLNTVRDTRLRLGHPVVPSTWSRSERSKQWTTWDWTKSDVELSQQHAISRERVRQIRAELGMPSRRETTHERHSEQEKAFLLWVDGRAQINNLEAIHCTGFHPDLIRKWSNKHNIIRILAKKSANARIPWKQMNWQLSNVALTKAWGLGENSCSIHRSNMNLPPSHYHVPEEFDSDIYKAELAKAQAWRAR